MAAHGQSVVNGSQRECRLIRFGPPAIPYLIGTYSVPGLAGLYLHQLAPPPLHPWGCFLTPAVSIHVHSNPTATR